MKGGGRKIEKRRSKKIKGEGRRGEGKGGEEREGNRRREERKHPTTTALDKESTYNISKTSSMLVYLGKGGSNRLFKVKVKDRQNLQVEFFTEVQICLFLGHSLPCNPATKN